MYQFCWPIDGMFELRLTRWLGWIDSWETHFQSFWLINFRLAVGQKRYAGHFMDGTAGNIDPYDLRCLPIFACLKIFPNHLNLFYPFLPSQKKIFPSSLELFSRSVIHQRPGGETWQEIACGKPFEQNIFDMILWVNIDDRLNTRNDTYHVTNSHTTLLTCKKNQSLQITEVTSWGHLATQPHPLEGGGVAVHWGGVPWRGIKRGGWH